MSCRATLSDLIDALAQNMTTAEIAQTAIRIEISQTIRDRRKKLGLSQKDLADRMGVKQSLVSRWESNDCNFTIDTLVDIADALGLSVQCPLTFDEANVSPRFTKFQPESECTAVEEKESFSNAIQFNQKNILSGGAA